MVQGTDLFEAQSTKQGRENRVASHGCPVAFSRRILKALRLPWQPTTAAARCNYLKNARRSPIPLAPPLYHPPPLRGLLGTGRCKSSRSLLHHHGQSKILYIFVHFITCSSGVIHGMIDVIAWSFTRIVYFLDRKKKITKKEGEEKSILSRPPFKIFEIEISFEKCKMADIFFTKIIPGIFLDVRFLFREGNGGQSCGNLFRNNGMTYTD